MKVLDRRKMIWVNGLLLALLVLSVIGCTLLGPVRLESSKLCRIYSPPTRMPKYFFAPGFLAFFWESPSAAAWPLAASCYKRCCAIR